MSSFVTNSELKAGLKQDCSRGIPVAWTLAFIVVLVGIIILIILYVRLGTVKIDPSSCPNIKGDYGVNPSTNGIVLQVCGDRGTEPCTSQQPSLSSAIARCDQQFSICGGFTYDGATFSIIDTKGDLIPTVSNVNTYIRQVQISS